MDTISEIKRIAQNFGLTISDDDIRYSEVEDAWYITPFEQGGGIKCREGVWWAEGINCYNIRLIQDSDWDMFDTIAEGIA